MTDYRFTSYVDAVEAHEMHGGVLTVDNISGGGATAQGLRPDELDGYLVTCEVPDWRADLLQLTDEEWRAANWDETKLGGAA
jgi:hypothetical protein